VYVKSRASDGIGVNYQLPVVSQHGNAKSQVKKVKVKERIVLREINLRTTGRHLSMGSHSVICHPRWPPRSVQSSSNNMPESGVFQRSC